MKKLLLLLSFITLSFSIGMDAKRGRSYGAHSRKTYTPKAPYAGLGKPSTSTGRIKTRITSGYCSPSRGYKYVNPYARS